MAVSDRVDRAWHKGFVAAQHAWKKVAVVEFISGAYLLLRRRRVPVGIWVLAFYGVLFATLLAVCIAPLVIVFLLVRAIHRAHGRRPVPATVVVLDNGEEF